MTPIRETIARAIYASFAGGTSDETLDDMAMAIAQSAADAVLRALDEAGMVVVPRDPSDAMQKAGAGAVRIDWHCAWTVEKCPTSFAADCLPDIYRAMIAASKVPG